MTNQALKENTKVSYITSIDGLRAIAVGLVVLFHAGFSGFSGGFIGVDVFFVISGFLITSNILHQRENGSFSFGSFYQKRIARLFPALFTTIIITLIAGFFILSPPDVADLGSTGIYASLSLSNIFFWLDSGYFEKASEVKPFLHTWSLSVEEQFYLFWPATLLVLYKIGKRSAIIIGLGILSIISIVAALEYQSIDSEAVFFLAPFRIYQFGLGALIVFLPTERFQFARGILTYVAVAGMLVIGYRLAGSDNLLLAAITPALLASVFIFGATSPICDKLFSSKPLVWIGQRSYSIYLVHWPLMTLWKINTDYEFSTFEKYIAVTLSILLGALLHQLVEKRFRFNSTFTPQIRNRVITATLCFLIINITISSHYWGEHGYPKPIPEELKAIAGKLGPSWKARTSILRDGECNLIFHSYTAEDYNWDLCLKNEKNKETWLILGDSHASGAYLIFKKAYPEINFNQLTIPGCRLRPSKRINGESMCDKLQRDMLKRLSEEKHITGVIIASNWITGLVYEIEELINEIRATKKKVILIGQRAMFNDSIPKIILSSTGRDEAISKAESLLTTKKVKLKDQIHERFKAMAPMVDIFDLQCPFRCDILNKDDKLLYLDESHFSIEGIDMIAERLQKEHPTIGSFKL